MSATRYCREHQQQRLRACSPRLTRRSCRTAGLVELGHVHHVHQQKEFNLCPLRPESAFRPSASSKIAVARVDPSGRSYL
jgi:hypothetical protein